MASSTRTIGLTIVLTAVTTVTILGLTVAGCSQRQDNSPINICYGACQNGVFSADWRVWGPLSRLIGRVDG